MRRAALVALLSSCLASAADRADRPSAKQQARANAQGRHDPAAARRRLSRNNAGLMVDAIGRDAGDLPDPPARPGCRLPAISSCSIPNGFPAGTARANDIKNVTGFRASSNGQQLKWVRDNARRLCFPRERAPGRRARSTSTIQYVTPTTGNQGRIARNSRHGEHPVAIELDVPCGLFRPRHPGPGFGDRPPRLEGRDRASTERTDRQPRRLSGDELRDPDGLAADRGRSLPANTADEPTLPSMSSPTTKPSSQQRPSRSRRTSGLSNRR